MSGETEKDVSGLTTDTLKLLMDAELRRIDSRFAAFLETYSREQDKANEFRSALDDLGKTMATRRELESAVAAMNQRTDSLASQATEFRSRLDIGPAAIPTLQAYQQQQQGRAAGVGASLGVIVAAVTVTAGVLGIVIVVANVLTK